MMVNSYQAVVAITYLLAMTELMTEGRSPPTRDVEFDEEEWSGPPKFPKKVFLYTMHLGNMTVKLTNYGATLVSIFLPDCKGKVDDVLLGFDDLEGYLRSDNPYFGATVGRVANRIADASFTLDGVTYKLEPNLGPNTIHGGFNGLSKVVWDAEIKDTLEERILVMRYFSRDGEAGFPGNVHFTAEFSLRKNEFSVNYYAQTDKRTPISLTNHAYFNLAGDSSNTKGIYEHVVSIQADQYTVLNEQSLPTGEIATLDGSSYDLRKATNLGEAINKTAENGFDLNYVIPNATRRYVNGQPETQFVARVSHPKSGRTLEVSTNQPGVQFYTSNSIETVPGKSWNVYKKHSAFCLEPQQYPDAVHHENFPSAIVDANYWAEIVYAFKIEDKCIYKKKTSGNNLLL